MSYIKPTEVINAMVDNGVKKAQSPLLQMLIRGFLGGAILACATTLAFTAVSQTGIGLVGAIVFPVGFVIIVLLGLELVTGNFALIPLAVLDKKVGMTAMIKNWSYVTIGHILGCLTYAVLYGMAVTEMYSNMEGPLVQTLISVAEKKTIGYEMLGAKGMLLVFIKAILCNWMVTLGVVMALTSTSTGGKIMAMWLPIFIFFAQGFEHAVVNMFVIPMGMLLGADVSIADWWTWNQIPVLFGNLVGGVLLTGGLFYFSHRTVQEAGGRKAEELHEKNKVCIDIHSEKGGV